MGIIRSYPKESILWKLTATPEDYYNEINKSLQNDSESNKEINVENEKYKTIKIICGTILLGLIFQILGALSAFKFYVEHTHPYDPNELYVKAGLQQCSYVDENEKLAITKNYDNPYRTDKNDNVKFLWKKECK